MSNMVFLRIHGEPQLALQKLTTLITYGLSLLFCAFDNDNKIIGITVDLHLNLTRNLHRIMHQWFSIILLRGKAFLALKWVRLACKYALELDQVWVQINTRRF